MTHPYPKGALTSEKDLFFARFGQLVYAVHGLGANSFMHELHDITLALDEEPKRLHYCKNDRNYKNINGSICLADFNIGAHHNNHYLFRFEEDALAYLIYAKQNTSVSAYTYILLTTIQ